MKELMAARHPVFATADIVVDSREVPHEAIVTEIIEALARSPAIAATPTSAGESP